MEKPTVLALGFFDGVHLGHGALLRACRAMAEKRNLPAGVVTFDIHPDALVFGGAPGLINASADRALLMEQLYGMHRIITLPFDRPMMQMPWQDFFRLLLERYHAAGLVCGHDFTFGAGGKGTAALLCEAAERAGIDCTVIPEQRLDGITVSSSYIRALLAAGNVEQANRFLGHPHILSGQVVSGRRLGRTLGIPTANLSIPQGLQELARGVYACKVHAGGAVHLAVTNVGTRPTVDGHHLTVEPWILDYSGDLYGQTIRLEFHHFLRPERKFDTLDDLKAEIHRNAEQTRRLLT